MLHNSTIKISNVTLHNYEDRMLKPCWKPWQQESDLFFSVVAKVASIDTAIMSPCLSNIICCHAILNTNGDLDILPV